MTTASTIKLTEWTSCGGCAAKWGGAPLSALLRQMAGSADPALLLGLAPFDDAAVYQLTADLALVSTTDFFPPLVDDPDDFGAIAAANACSDIFAMGGRVVLALNIAAFPERFPVEAAAAIMAAAAEVVRDAGGSVAGGHTIRSEEPIFGLAVQGLIHPGRIWSKAGARPGDRLVLSKPLGSGIVLAGADEADKATAIATMRRLNRDAAADLAALPDRDGSPAVHAVTDVTGFGLAGHGWELAQRAAATVRFHGQSLPLYPGALAAAEAGTRTGGDARNRAYLGSSFRSTAPPAVEALTLDPQTSGGLLAAVVAADARDLVGRGWWEVGSVVSGTAGVEVVQAGAQPASSVVL
jgi:selenide,water dikinase